MEKEDFEELEVAVKAEVEQQQWPEEHGANVLQRWTYGYLDPLLSKGAKASKNNLELSENDLFRIPQAMQAPLLLKEMR